MGGNAPTAMKDLDRACGDARPNRLAQQLVRHRVVVLLDLDVIVEPDPALLPFGKEAKAGRQRLEGRALQLLEERAAARTEVPRHAIIELHLGPVRRSPRSMLRARRIADCAAWR